MESQYIFEQACALIHILQYFCAYQKLLVHLATLASSL